MPKLPSLHKDDPAYAGPLDLRPLLILPTMYRRWASLRLKNCTPWVQQWQMEHMFAGVLGYSAEDAAYGTAIEIEDLNAQETPYTGAIADIFKCFDQVCRELITTLLRRAGFPERILQPYMSMLSNLVVRNAFAGHIGKGHQHPCGLPQGCPFSMMATALLLRPWICKMVTLQGLPRVLADDILVLTSGTNHLRRIVPIVEATFAYIADIGGAAAPDKSALFSSTDVGRTVLRQHKWNAIGNRTIKTVLHFRDLGAHLCTTAVTNGATLTARLVKAVRTFTLAGYLPTDIHTKYTAIRTKGLPYALYGCETQPVAEAPMAKLRTATVDTLGPKSTRRAQHIVLATTAQYGPDVDPHVEVAVRRAKLLHRTYYKQPHLQPAIHRLMRHYTSTSANGTLTTHTDLAALTPAPFPGVPNRSSHTAITTRLTKLGPTALFLQTMHEFATAVDEQLHIHQHQETPQHLLTMPCQNIAPFIRSIAARARTTTAADRTAINHLDEIDHYAIAQVHKAMPDEDTRLLVHISSGATWTQEAKANADSTVARKCPHCSHPDQNWSHTLQCPGLAPGLRHLLPLPQDFDLTALPLNVTLAVPNAIVPHCNRTFWGDEASKFQDLPEAAQNALGLKVYTGPKFATGAATDMLIDACTANGYAQSMEQQPTCRVYRNARQIAAALRNVNTSASRLAQTEQHAVTSFQEGSVPTSPNVYIDGGLLHPAKPDWQLGTFGAWHVDRNVPNMSFSDFELAHSVLKRASGG